MKTVCSVLLLCFCTVPSAFSAPADSASSKNAAYKVTISVIPNLVKFDTVRFDAPAGGQVELTLKNGCVIPHNLVILRKESEAAVLAAVEALGAEGFEKGFVPDSPGIVAATKLLPSTQKQTITFRVPEKEGEYPYVCTFPGHWFTMRGVMKVVAPDHKLESPVKDPSLKESTDQKVPDALKRAKITHIPLGTLEKPLVMRTFAPDPGLDPAVFAHHSNAKPGIKYDPKTRQDITQESKNAAGEPVRTPVVVSTQPGVVGAIAVNHGAGFSYVWDSTECRLLYVWRDGFLNMNPYWGKEPGSSREKNYIPKLYGKLVYCAAGSSPLSISQDPAPGFGGYRMVDGSPEFWYRLGGDVVREKVVPGDAGGFQLQVRIEGTPREWKIRDFEKETVRLSRSGAQNAFEVRFTDQPQPAPAQETPKK
jgi:azurin